MNHLSYTPVTSNTVQQLKVAVVTSLVVQWWKLPKFPLQGAWVEFLVRELRSHMTCWESQKKKSCIMVSWCSLAPQRPKKRKLAHRIEHFKRFYWRLSKIGKCQTHNLATEQQQNVKQRSGHLHIVQRLTQTALSSLMAWEIGAILCCLGWFKCPPHHRKDHMVSKGPPHASGSRVCIAISKATCDGMFAEGLLSRLLSLNSFKLEHGHYLSVSLQCQVTKQQLFLLCYLFFKSSQKNHSKLKGKQF